MKAQTKKPVAAKQGSHQIRLIGGLWKRTPLSVISADGLRPTPDRVRETVFNWINHLVDGHWQNLRCLDLFAGSGALGFEAASRGAAQVTMVEYHTPAFRQLQQVKEKLGADQIELVRADALTLVTGLVARQQRFDLIFLDPPFNQGMLEKILPLCAKLLTESGFLYVEAEYALTSIPPDENTENKLNLLQDWRMIRADKAGSVYFHILQCNILVSDAA
ncbi:MAG: 16S rRNA (guanine(966)-N(2))-methyltransferase RsmD [Pseudomonadota bacterium]